MSRPAAVRPPTRWQTFFRTVRTSLLLSFALVVLAAGASGSMDLAGIAVLAAGVLLILSVLGGHR